METESQQPREREGVISTLNGFIEVFNLAKEISGNTPPKAMIRDTMISRLDYVELGLACADVCTTLNRGLDGKSEDDLNYSVREAIRRLREAAEEIREKITKQGKQNLTSRHLHAKNDKERTAAWRLDLTRILQVFNTELAINTHTTVSGTHTMVSDIYRTIVQSQEVNSGKHSLTQTGVPGKFPPLAPKTFFGRDELVKKIVDLAEDLTPIALIGAGGVWKTSVALTVLHHHDGIKQRFGHARRFIRCDQFPASCAHFLRRLSKVTGAGAETPEDLTPLYPYLSSREMLIVLDNAASILNPQGADAREIHVVVELSRFNNLCIFITSRISTTPSDFMHLDTPTLLMDAACDTFYHIYGNDNRSDLVNGILKRLDFHPLSITLLATVACQNEWDVKRLAKESGERRTRVLETGHSNSLAAMIKLSLTSPLFQQLGPDARALLEVVAFFPRGVDKNNLKWLFPTISDRANILDKFCVLLLTYRNDGFVTVLALLRDYLCPKDPKSSPLLCAVKECYLPGCQFISIRTTLGS